MLTMLNSLNARNFPIFQPILMILVSKSMVYRALSDKPYLSIGLLSPLMFYLAIVNKILRHCHSWLARQYMSTQVLLNLSLS